MRVPITDYNERNAEAQRRKAAEESKRALDKRVDARVAHGFSRRRWFGGQMRGGAK